MIFLMMHPASISLIAALFLYITLRHNWLRCFSYIAITAPILISYILYFQIDSTLFIYKILNFDLTISYSYNDKLIALAFLIVLFVANIYGLAVKRYKDLIYGLLYFASTSIALFTENFILLFIGMEMMMICAMIIIFVGTQRNSIKIAQKYFVTHFVSSNLIVIFLGYMISYNGFTYNMSFSNIGIDDMHLIAGVGDNTYLRIMPYILFTALLINIAVFPFSAWMSKYYTYASGVGFLYLISFTTKFNLILLLKFFDSGLFVHITDLNNIKNIFGGLGNYIYTQLNYFNAAEYIGVNLSLLIGCITLFYAAYKAFKEDNIFSFLCYLSIMQMCLIICLSVSSRYIDYDLFVFPGGKISVIYCYLFVHIIYKLLLSLYSAYLNDVMSIRCFSDVTKFLNYFSNKLQDVNLKLQSKIYLISFCIIFFIALSTMIALPFTSSFIFKNHITNLLSFDDSYLGDNISIIALNEYFTCQCALYIIYITNFLTLILFPWSIILSLFRILKNTLFNKIDNRIAISDIMDGYKNNNVDLETSLSVKNYVSKIYLFSSFAILGLLITFYNFPNFWNIIFSNNSLEKYYNFNISKVIMSLSATSIIIIMNLFVSKYYKRNVQNALNIIDSVTTWIYRKIMSCNTLSDNDRDSNEHSAISVLVTHYVQKLDNMHNMRISFFGVILILSALILLAII